MAVLDKKGVRGRIGPLTYRVVGSKNIIQSRPGEGTVKQTLASRICACEFGVASNTARAIRQIFYPVYQGLNDGGMINRLTSSVLKVIKGNREKNRGERDIHGGDLGYLNNFQFNTNSPLEESFLVRPLVELNEERKLTVTLPAFNVYKELKIPEKSNVHTIRITAAAFNFEQEFYQYCGIHNFEIKRGKTKQEALEWVCPDLMPAGCIILVSMSLLFSFNPYNMGTIVLNSKELQPAAIIAAFETAKVEGENVAVKAEEKKAEEKLDRGEIPLNNMMSLSGYEGNRLLEELKRAKATK